jgi:hypothetical protein
LEFACAICTGTDWLWINSDVYPLKPGLNKDFTFDLTAKTYKSAVTDWENTGTLMDMDDVKRVVFRISGPVGFEGTAYIDNIRLVE